ncbi:MAG TPA: DUF5076 domain-containing protein [Hansschlegelia sp.]
MSAAKAGPRQLAIPPEAHNAKAAAEVLRAWVIDNGLQVSLQRGFDDPGVWGILLTDIARHAARVFETEGVCSEEHALSAMKDMLDAEWDKPTDDGSLQAVQ